MCHYIKKSEQEIKRPRILFLILTLSSYCHPWRFYQTLWLSMIASTITSYKIYISIPELEFSISSYLLDISTWNALYQTP